MTGAQVREVRSLGQPRLTAGLDRHARLSLGAHRAIHGSPPLLSAGELAALATSIDARGRGGAAFPFARKLQSAARSAARGRSCVVVVNAMEGEPGSAKDAMLLTRTPHLVLDGAWLAATALSAREVVIGLAAGSPAEAALAHALAERDGSPSMTMRMAALPDRFVAGEGGALVRAINGGPGVPPGRKRRAVEAGVGGVPTLLSNAETFAQLAVLAALGPTGFAAVGTPAEPGTVLLTVGGAAARPAVVEVPSGTALADVLSDCGAPVGDGVLVGGYHGQWLGPAQVQGATVSRAGMAAVGGALGAGIVLPLGDDTCSLGEVARVARYLGYQSAGQCGPCRLGLPKLAHAVEALAAGAHRPAAVAALRRSASAVVGRGACAHPDGSARFIQSALDVLADEIAAHAADGSCGRPVRGRLPLPAPPDHIRLVVDWTRCQAHGLCGTVAPELVLLDSDGYPIISDVAVPPWLASQATRAVQMCPALALRVTPASERPADGGTAARGARSTGSRSTGSRSAGSGRPGDAGPAERVRRVARRVLTRV